DSRPRRLPDSARRSAATSLLPTVEGIQRNGATTKVSASIRGRDPGLRVFEPSRSYSFTSPGVSQAKRAAPCLDPKAPRHTGAHAHEERILAVCRFRPASFDAGVETPYPPRGDSNAFHGSGPRKPRVRGRRDA